MLEIPYLLSFFFLILFSVLPSSCADTSALLYLTKLRFSPNVKFCGSQWLMALRMTDFLGGVSWPSDGVRLVPECGAEDERLGDGLPAQSGGPGEHLPGEI